MSVVLQAFIVTVDATAQTVIMTLGGVYLARAGFVDRASASVISRMVMNLILPCLIFADIMTSVSLQSLASLGQVLLFTLSSA
jgi:predicted permease